MSAVLAIAHYTTLEALRNRLLWLVVGFVVGGFTFAEFIGEVAITESAGVSEQLPGRGFARERGVHGQLVCDHQHGARVQRQGVGAGAVPTHRQEQRTFWASCLVSAVWPCLPRPCTRWRCCCTRRSTRRLMWGMFADGRAAHRHDLQPAVLVYLCTCDARLERGHGFLCAGPHHHRLAAHRARPAWTRRPACHSS